MTTHLGVKFIQERGIIQDHILYQVYAEGGFDILFVGWGWGLDWDPTGLFDTPGIVPNGDNFYQYSHPEMDDAIGNYTASFVTSRSELNMQKIFKHSYMKTYHKSLSSIQDHSIPMTEDFTGWDSLLWASTLSTNGKLGY